MSLSRPQKMERKTRGEEEGDTCRKIWSMLRLTWLTQTRSMLTRSMLTRLMLTRLMLTRLTLKR